MRFPISTALIAFVFAMFGLAPPSQAAVEWGSHYGLALAQAKKERRPICAVYAAAGTGGKMNFVDSALEPALDGFVCVWVRDTSAGRHPLKIGGREIDLPWPKRKRGIFVFIDADTERLLIPDVVGELTLPVLARARAESALPLTPEMLRLLAPVEAKPDEKRLRDMTEAGDVAGLLAYLKPFVEHPASESNYVVVRVHLPPTAANDPIDIRQNRVATLRIPSSGVAVLSDRKDKSSLHLSITTRDCAPLSDDVSFKTERVVSRDYRLTPRPVSKGPVGAIAGTVILDGKPAPGAWVNVWAHYTNFAETRTDEDGWYSVEGIPIKKAGTGYVEVKVRTPGGVGFDRFLVTAGQTTTRQLVLAPATTVKLRWMQQREPNRLELTGPETRAGETYGCFAVKGSLKGLFGDQTEERDWSRSLLGGLCEIKRFEEELRDTRRRNGSFRWNPGLSPSGLREQNLKPGELVWWMDVESDKGRSGFHRESSKFHEIEAVNGGQPITDANYFEQFRGVRVRSGDVFTMRLPGSGRYMKVEVEVTHPAAAAR